MTLVPVDVEVTPHPEILYQAADPKDAPKSAIVLAGVLCGSAPLLWALVVILETPPPIGGTWGQFFAAALLLSMLLLFGSFAIIAAWAIAKPSPPPAITRDGVLVHSWIPFLARSPAEYKFETQRTVKGYRAGQYTVIELYPQQGSRTKVTVFDPDEGALKIVREAVLKSGSPLAEGRAEARR